MELFIGIVAGGLMTFITTHLYYRAQKRNDEKLAENVLNKLSPELKKIILDQNIKNISVKGLHKILDDKIIDKKELEKGNPMPYKACCKCGSKNLFFNEATDNKLDEVYYFVKCKDCGWQDWSQ